MCIVGIFILLTCKMESNAFQIGDFIESRVLGSQQSPSNEASESSKILDTEMRSSVMMELIVDKLKLLNYDREFCKSRSPPWPHLHKFYFTLPLANRNEQFLYFSTLVSWLFRLLGSQFAPPSEIDDPNVTCSKIMMELMSLGFAVPNWPPARLKQGYGDAVCNVLDALCSLVLHAIKYEFTPLTHVCQEDLLQVAPDDTSYNDYSSELYMLDEQDTNSTYCDDEIPRVTRNPHVSNDLNSTENALLAAKKWKLDLERIAPQLRIVVVADANDWREHLDRAKKLYEDTFSTFNIGKTHLKKFEEDVMSSLEKLDSHENFINQEFESLILEYVAVKGRLSGLEEKQKKMGEVVTKLTNEHAKIMESLTQVKQKLVEKGNEISDLSPMLHMKSAMQKLKRELREMEVQIGVLEHSLLQVQAKGAIDAM